MSAGGSKKVIIISLFANLGIALSKLGGAMFTHSASLMAEAVHSFADCGNQVLLLYGQKVAVKAPSKKFPLGHGKEGFFWSFVVALLLFSMGGMFSIYEGTKKLSGHGSLEHPIVGIAILSIAVLLEGFSFYACLKEVRKENTFGNMKQWVKKTSNAYLLVIFLEDFAALLGLIIGLIALTLAWITGNTFWDGFGSVLIGLLLISVAIVLAKEVKSMLIGEATQFDYSLEIGRIAKTISPSLSLLKVISMYTGVNEVLLTYKVHPGDIASSKELIDSINRLENEVKLKFPEVKWQFAEPDYTE